MHDMTMEKQQWKEFQAKFKGTGACTIYAAREMLVQEYVQEERKRQEEQERKRPKVVGGNSKQRDGYASKSTDEKAKRRESTQRREGFDSMVSGVMGLPKPQVQAPIHNRRSSFSFGFSADSSSFRPTQRRSSIGSALPRQQRRSSLGGVIASSSQSKRGSFSGGIASLSEMKSLSAYLSKFVADDTDEDEEDNDEGERTTGNMCALSQRRRVSATSTISRCSYYDEPVETEVDGEIKTFSNDRGEGKGIMFALSQRRRLSVTSTISRCSYDDDPVETEADGEIKTFSNEGGEKKGIMFALSQRRRLTATSTISRCSYDDDPAEIEADGEIKTFSNDEGERKGIMFALSQIRRLSTTSMSSHCSYYDDPVEIETNGEIKTFSMKEEDILVDFPSVPRCLSLPSILASGKSGAEKDCDPGDEGGGPIFHVETIRATRRASSTNYPPHSDTEMSAFRSTAYISAGLHDEADSVKPVDWVDGDEDEKFTHEEHEEFVKPANWIDYDEEDSDEDEDKYESACVYTKSAT